MTRRLRDSRGRFTSEMTSQTNWPVLAVVTIHFGAMCDPIEKQLKDQGVKLPKNKVRCFQDLANCITILKIQGILPDSVVHKAHQTLMKKISEAIHKGA